MGDRSRLRSLFRHQGPPKRPNPELIAVLESQDQAARRQEDRELARAVAAAVCAKQGHIPEPSAMDHGDWFTPWGIGSPFRAGPSCQRCGAELDAA